MSALPRAILCFNHPVRTASARCPECNRHYCRECITEHDDRVICAVCLAAITGDAEATSSRVRWIWQWVIVLVSVFSLWFIFFSAGQLLLRMPSSFHDGLFIKSIYIDTE